MTIERTPTSACYHRIADGTRLGAVEAEQEIGVNGECKIIKHTVEVSIRYLVEYPDGTRVWRNGWKS